MTNDFTLPRDAGFIPMHYIVNATINEGVIGLVEYLQSIMTTALTEGITASEISSGSYLHQSVADNPQLITLIRMYIEREADARARLLIHYCQLKMAQSIADAEVLKGEFGYLIHLFNLHSCSEMYCYSERIAIDILFDMASSTPANAEKQVVIQGLLA